MRRPQSDGRPAADDPASSGDEFLSLPDSPAPNSAPDGCWGTPRSPADCGDCEEEVAVLEVLEGVAQGRIPVSGSATLLGGSPQRPASSRGSDAGLLADPGGGVRAVLRRYSREGSVASSDCESASGGDENEGGDFRPLARAASEVIRTSREKLREEREKLRRAEADVLCTAEAGQVVLATQRDAEERAQELERECATLRRRLAEAASERDAFHAELKVYKGPTTAAFEAERERRGELPGSDTEGVSPRAREMDRVRRDLVSKGHQERRQRKEQERAVRECEEQLGVLREQLEHAQHSAAQAEWRRQEAVGLLAQERRLGAELAERCRALEAMQPPRALGSGSPRSGPGSPCAASPTAECGGGGAEARQEARRWREQAQRLRSELDELRAGQPWADAAAEPPLDEESLRGRGREARERRELEEQLQEQAARIQDLEDAAEGLEARLAEERARARARGEAAAALEARLSEESARARALGDAAGQRGAALAEAAARVRALEDAAREREEALQEEAARARALADRERRRGEAAAQLRGLVRSAGEGALRLRLAFRDARAAAAALLDAAAAEIEEALGAAGRAAAAAAAAAVELPTAELPAREAAPPARDASGAGGGGGEPGGDGAAAEEEVRRLREALRALDAESSTVDAAERSAQRSRLSLRISDLLWEQHRRGRARHAGLAPARAGRPELREAATQTNPTPLATPETTLLHFANSETVPMKLSFGGCPVDSPPGSPGAGPAAAPPAAIERRPAGSGLGSRGGTLSQVSFRLGNTASANGGGSGDPTFRLEAVAEEDDEAGEVVELKLRLDDARQRLQAERRRSVAALGELQSAQQQLAAERDARSELQAELRRASTAAEENSPGALAAALATERARLREYEEQLRHLAPPDTTAAPGLAAELARERELRAEAVAGRAAAAAELAAARGRLEEERRLRLGEVQHRAELRSELEQERVARLEEERRRMRGDAAGAELEAVRAELRNALAQLADSRRAQRRASGYSSGSKGGAAEGEQPQPHWQAAVEPPPSPPTSPPRRPPEERPPPLQELHCQSVSLPDPTAGRLEAGVQCAAATAAAGTQTAEEPHALLAQHDAEMLQLRAAVVQQEQELSSLRAALQRQQQQPHGTLQLAAAQRELEAAEHRHRAETRRLEATIARLSDEVLCLGEEMSILRSQRSASHAESSSPPLLSSYSDGPSAATGRRGSGGRRDWRAVLAAPCPWELPAAGGGQWAAHCHSPSPPPCGHWAARCGTPPLGGGAPSPRPQPSPRGRALPVVSGHPVVG